MRIFTDPILRAPLWGVVILSLPISLLGVWLFVRRRALIGEVLAHASYPGVLIAIFLAPLFHFSWMILLCALGSSLIGLVCIHFLKEQLRIKEDAALSFVLSTFFGVGTLLASIVQSTHPVLFAQIPMYLYGQAATMQDQYLIGYGCFSVLVVALLFICYRPLLILSFDRIFAQALRPSVRHMDLLLWLLIACAVVLGMRSLGVILLSALMIAPATAARQFTHDLSSIFVLSGLFGMLSGFIGVLLSLSGLPTGPCIVLTACVIALGALCFAPNRGALFRLVRQGIFRLKILEENVVKGLWQNRSVEAPWWVWSYLKFKGLIDDSRQLTSLGLSRGAYVVRLHRLWEVYLVRSLGMNTDQVHACAEQMEHVLTEDLEKELTALLGHPLVDPHAKPIPVSDGGVL